MRPVLGVHWKDWCWSWNSNTSGHLIRSADSLEKTLMLGKIEGQWRQEEKGTTEVEMAGWHHWLNGHDFGWTLGVGNEQGGLVCCSSWCRKELDTTEGLNWTELSRSTLALPVFFLGLASSFRLQKSSHSDGPLLYSLVLLIFLCLLCSLLSLIFSWDTVMGMSLKHLLLPLAESSQDLPSSFTDIIVSCCGSVPPCLSLLFTLQNHLSSSLVKVRIIQ